jgi:hypothetical protein
LYNNDVFLDELANAINIYITSDEEIKEGNWFLDITDNTLWRNMVIEDMSKTLFPECKKIILTTDPTLIADGVQEIDNEFLEWFIKNPSCDFIEVKEKSPNEIEKELGIYGHDIGLTENEYSEWLKNGGQLYKIIVPQEGDKQEILPEFKLSKDIFNKLSCLSSKELPQEFSKLINENFNELISEEPINLHKMEKKEITAIEFLIEKLKLESIDLSKWHQNLINEAKEIEKQQIVSAWENGYEEGAGVNDYSCFHGIVYYNKTFSL